VRRQNLSILFRRVSGKISQGQDLQIATRLLRSHCHRRRGVFYGNIPDFSQVEGWDVAVIGGGNSALQIVENLQAVAGKIHLVSNSELKADQAVIERVCQIPGLIRYEGYQTLAFTGDKRLAGIAIRKREEEKMIEIPVRGVFIAVGLQLNSSLAASLLSLNERGEIPVGPDCSTSRRGLFAAGDVTDAFGKRIIIAAGEGAKAAIAAREYLLYLEKRARVEQP
jgi:alkyl hydroperoxide reductase subunit F